MNDESAAAVIICTYSADRWADLRAAVDSVHTQSRPATEVLVVVDHNADLLARARGAFPTATVVANTGPRGLSGARNTGIDHTRAPIVAFLDDDARAEPHWLERLLVGYREPRVIGIGGAAMPEWDRPAPRWWPAEFGWVVGCSYRGQPTRRAPVRNTMGCNMSFRREVFAAVGGFDTAFGRTGNDGAGCEETELCIRATRRFTGSSVVYEPQAVVLHRVPAERARFRYFLGRCWAEGRSKALLSTTLGPTDALNTEYAYARTVLPDALTTAVKDFVFGDRSAGLRAAAIVAGATATVAGYLRTRSSGDRLPVTPRTVPVLPMIVDTSDPTTATIDPDDADYRHVHCLILHAGVPAARLRLDVPAGVPLSTAALRTLLGEHGHPVEASSAPRTDRVEAADVCVVVATRDRPDSLADCLDAIAAGTTVPRRLIVVDNAPADDRTARLVHDRAQHDPRLHYVREDRPGLAAAHNAALPHITEPIVAFTDDDVLVHPDWLDRIIAPFTDPQVGCVTGLIAPRRLDTAAEQWVEANTTYDKGLRRRVFDPHVDHPDQPLFPYTAGAFGSGANMAFRTAHLREVGGFDPALGAGTPAMGGDDLAAFVDVLHAGRTLVYEPAAIVRHAHHRETADLHRQTYGYGVGLGAYLTRSLLRDPAIAWVAVRQARAVRAHARATLAPPAVPGIDVDLARLKRRHRRGLMAGPARYLRSRWALAHDRRNGKEPR